VLVDDQPDPADTPATVPALAALLTATTVPATTVPGTTNPGTLAGKAVPGPIAELPVGARLLSAGEAVALLATRTHPEAATAVPALDRALIDAIRAGTVLACQLSDGRISFTRRGP
jgi:hypothetical protein